MQAWWSDESTITSHSTTGPSSPTPAPTLFVTLFCEMLRESVGMGVPGSALPGEKGWETKTDLSSTPATSATTFCVLYLRACVGGSDRECVCMTLREAALAR